MKEVCITRFQGRGFGALSDRHAASQYRASRLDRNPWVTRPSRCSMVVVEGFQSPGPSGETSAPPEGGSGATDDPSVTTSLQWVAASILLIISYREFGTDVSTAAKTNEFQSNWGKEGAWFAFTSPIYRLGRIWSGLKPTATRGTLAWEAGAQLPPSLCLGLVLWPRVSLWWPNQGYKLRTASVFFCFHFRFFSFFYFLFLFYSMIK